MQKYLRFPKWKEKALTLSYDDGVIFDRKLIEIMNRYSLKGTFNINSGLFDSGKRRLNKDEAYELYSKSGQEVAIHGEKHLFLTNTTLADGIAEIYNDKKNLEKMFGKIIRGMAYANGNYSDEIINYLSKLGICYSRTCIATGGFDIPKDWLKLPTTCHHTDPKLMEYTDRFLEVQPSKQNIKNPLLFYLWGHSYEFNDGGNWNIIEDFAKKTGNRDDIWYATNIEMYDYIQAYNNLIFSADCSIVYNPSIIRVFVEIDGKNILIEPNENKAI